MTAMMMILSNQLASIHRQEEVEEAEERGVMVSLFFTLFLHHLVTVNDTLIFSLPCVLLQIAVNPIGVRI